MTEHYLNLHLSPAVREAQFETYGQSQSAPVAMEPDRLGAREAAFIRARDSFYLASLTEAGAPYIQHRGGPAGFLQVLDERTLGFLDYSGNRQLLTTGHLRRDPRVALFLMDYAARRRLKIDGEAEVVPIDTEAAERLVRIRVEAFDWNCPQFITPRFSAAELEQRERPLRDRIGELERQLHQLRSPARDQQPGASS